MPRFYTVIVNDNAIEIDEEGQEFQDADAAVTNAGRTAVAILEQHLTSHDSAAALKVFVEDADHHRVATVSVMGSINR